MQVRGTVVSVEIDVQVAKKDGGTYPGARFSYRDESGALKEQGFHNNTFKFNGALKTQLANLNAGQKFVMEKVKNGEFWNVTSILPEDNAAPVATTTGGAKATAVASPKSNYETPEERAQRQVYIIRQSSLSNSIALVDALGDKKATPQSVIAQAKLFEAYVFNTTKPEVAEDDFPGDEDEVIQ